MKKLLSLLLSVTLLLSFVACGKTAVDETDTTDEVSKTEETATEPTSITVTDLAGREVTVKTPVESVVLTFNFEEYIATTGEEGLSKVVGWSRKYWEGRRQSTWDAFSKEIPEINDIPDVGYIGKGTFNVETVMALKPDVVFMALNDFEKETTDITRLEEAGIPVVFMDYHKQTMENHVASTLLYGQVMGKTERAQELVDFYQTNSQLVFDRIADIKGDKPTAYMEFSGDEAGPDVMGGTWGKKMWGAIITNCGGTNIAYDLVEGTSGEISMEQVLLSDPDVIMFAGNYVSETATNVGLGYEVEEETALNNLNGYKSRAGWNELSAVKNNRMGALYHDLSRHIFDVAGVQFIAKQLYPDEFADVDPVATLKEFHDKFYPIDLTGIFMVSLGE